MEFLGYELGELLTRQVIYFLITFFVGILLLHLATGILSFHKRSFGKAAGTVIIGAVVMSVLAFIPYVGRIIGLISFWYFIKSFYDVSWGKAILAWIMSILVAFIVAVVVLILFDISILFVPKL